VGIWNERGYTIDYINILRDTLNNYGFEDTSIVAHDEGWDIASDILNNPQLASSVDVIGVHVRASIMGRSSAWRLTVVEHVIGMISTPVRRRRARQSRRESRCGPART
jgi:hypothetical protein